MRKKENIWIVGGTRLFVFVVSNRTKIGWPLVPLWVAIVGLRRHRTRRAFTNFRAVNRRFNDGKSPSRRLCGQDSDERAGEIIERTENSLLREIFFIFFRIFRSVRVHTVRACVRNKSDSLPHTLPPPPTSNVKNSRTPATAERAGASVRAK